jgi:hypothetical protein
LTKQKIQIGFYNSNIGKAKDEANRNRPRDPAWDDEDQLLQKYPLGTMIPESTMRNMQRKQQAQQHIQQQIQQQPTQPFGNRRMMPLPHRSNAQPQAQYHDPNQGFPLLFDRALTSNERASQSLNETHKQFTTGILGQTMSTTLGGPQKHRWEFSDSSQPMSKFRKMGNNDDAPKEENEAESIAWGENRSISTSTTRPARNQAGGAFGKQCQSREIPKCYLVIWETNHSQSKTLPQAEQTKHNQATRQDNCSLTPLPSDLKTIDLSHLPNLLSKV